VGLALAFAILVGDASGQAAKPKAKPLATPPVISPAEVISRADDYVEPRVVPASVSEKQAVSSENPDSETIKKLGERIKQLESAQKADKDESQKRLLLNLDILTRAEQRSESLRKQVFEMIEKENSVKARLDQIEIDMRPEAIERTLQLAGSMRPEEVRENRRRSLDAEKRNLNALLNDIQATKLNLQGNLQKADAMVEKLRIKLEKDIDENFLKDDPTDRF
jgi:hypothetical protein